MRWPDYFPAAVMVLYLAAALGYWLHEQNGLALAYLCYAGANVGLIWAAMS
jgi:hypothetical protein